MLFCINFKENEKVYFLTKNYKKYIIEKYKLNDRKPRKKKENNQPQQTSNNTIVSISYGKFIVEF